MSDPSAGARAPDTYPPATYAETYPATTPAETYPATTTGTTSGGDDSAVKQAAGQAKQAAGQSAQAAGQAASEVKDTAKEQVQRVGAEAKNQARSVASDVKDRVGSQARTQNDKLVGGIRQVADQLDEMRGDRQDSPAATVVSRVAEGGRQMADYLDRNGPEGVLREVQDFARRRPGAFLATALAAGFVVGRLGKGVMKADDSSSTGTSAKPSSDSFVSTPETYGTGGTGTVGAYGTGGTAAGGYADPVPTGTPYTATTEYAATGTGTPLVVEEEFVVDPARDYPGGTR
ncbi:hypothetical protein [Actinoplanes friuliensis]|uniref:Uncharacterized protein n=1 Tax=Actinoplanes friuliensis DSM 7358 TaxID=1246995 RepID=U5W2S4_9ACTN|nr:hypothetical protein [Actinoplanes friuliensis]AGZ42285.1 hypothetical protein AFR_20065 [Actinoplanes friuliensis DSM 7358]